MSSFAAISHSSIVSIRYPRSIANLPDVVLQLRKHSESKTNTQRKSLSAASDVVRWHLVSHALSEHFKEVHHTTQSVPVNTCPRAHAISCSKLKMTKKSMDLLVHPVQLIRSERDAHEAMEMLAVLFTWVTAQGPVRAHTPSETRLTLFVTNTV